MTLAFAEDLAHTLKNPPPPPKPLTWADIFAEEPFEGEHWEGVYGLPPGSVRGKSQDATYDLDTSPSLSPLESDVDLEDDDTNSLSEPRPTILEKREPIIKSAESDKTVPPYTVSHQQSLENMRTKQYWKGDWQADVDTGREFDLNDPSTLGLCSSMEL